MKTKYEIDVQKVVEYCLALLIGSAFGINIANALFDNIVNPLSIITIQEVYIRATILGVSGIILWLSVMIFSVINSGVWLSKGFLRMALGFFLIGLAFFTVVKWIIFLVRNVQ